MIQELRRNPSGLRKFIGKQAQGVFGQLSREIEDAGARGDIRPIAPEHLFANVIALCVFPFIARPMLETVTGMDPATYDAFLEDREAAVSDFILRALRP